MDVFIVGEDDACRAVIRRIIAFCAQMRNTAIEILPQEFPVRGGEIRSMITKLNMLSVDNPVIFLADLDNNTCPPVFIETLMRGEAKNDEFVLSVAVDEVESWLLADRHGFAQYFAVDVTLIPEPSQIKMQGRVEKTEISCGYKSSLYFVTQILPHSRNKILVEQLTPREGAIKGREYNTGMIPFIREHWNIQAAMNNSDSLRGMVNRIFRLIDKTVLLLVR